MGSFPIRAEDLHNALEPDGWLGHATPPHFAAFADSPVELPTGDAERFFATRGLKPRAAEGERETVAGDLVALDLRAIAHGMSVLHSEQAEQAALRLLPSAARVALGEDPPKLDHVGVEIFGRLEWYIDAISTWAVGGTVRVSHHRTFPSVQVRKALAYDPQLGDVRIARVYLEIGERTVNLELFEAIQDWRYTVARQLALFSDRPRDGFDRVAREIEESFALPLEPVGHLALRVEHWQTVESVHRLLAGPADCEAARRLHDERPSYNAADRSLNSKILTVNGTLARSPVFGRVVELISYEVDRAPGELERTEGATPVDLPAPGPPR